MEKTDTTILPAPVIQNEKTDDSSAFDSGARMQFKPVGSSGTDLLAGYFSEEYLQQLRGRRGAKVWDEIRRSEAQVAMLMNAIMNPIKSATWEFEAAPTVPNGQLHKDLVEYCAKDMIDWETHLHEALTFLMFGFSLFEIVHNVVFNHEKFGTFNGLKGLAFRSQKTIERWIVNSSTGELQFVEQWIQGDLVPNGERASMPKMLADFLLVFTLQKEGDNYEGISALRPMYGPWFRKNLYQKIMGIGIEKNAIGTPIGKVPSAKHDKAQEEEFKQVLSNFTAHEAAYLMVPEGWDVEIIQNSFDAGKVKEAILLENTEMINAVVANFLALGVNGGSGSFALGTDLSDFFLSGIQTYANIVAGVWNRKLIPNLVKLNYGPQASYPKLKVSGINDKAGEELAKILDVLATKKIIKPDDKLEAFTRKRYSLPVADPTTVREVDPPKPFLGGQFHEHRLKLAEGWKAQWKEDQKEVEAVMENGLQHVLNSYVDQIKRMYKSATAAQKPGLALKLEPKISEYTKELREVLAQVANRSLAGARKDTPWAKNIKLSERIQLAAPKGGYFDALPPKVKRLVQAQAAAIAQTQAADIEKVVVFQYGSSQATTESLDQIIADIDEVAIPRTSGASVAAGNAVSQVSNQARMEWFFEPEVFDTIESFTFFNEDPVSEICSELDGTTWAANDPDLDRYSPPLHHNCKSRLQPNEKGAEGNPEIQRGGTAVTQKGLDSITLCEGHYHLVDPEAGL